jgi:hypothetical protein
VAAVEHHRFDGAMSDWQQGPDWHQGPDGKWYPPNPGSSDPGWGTPVLAYDPPEGTTSPTLPPGAKAPVGGHGGRSKRSAVFAIVGVLVVAGLATGVYFGLAPTAKNATATSGVRHKTAPLTTAPPTTAPPTTAPPTTAPPTTSPPTTTAARAASRPSVPASFAGTAHPTFASGAPGKLDLIYVGTAYSLGPGSGTVVPVEVWNGTSQTLSALDISGSAMSGSKVIGSGDSQDVTPYVLASGQVDFGIVFFTQDLPAGTTFSLTATASSGTSGFANPKVVQANYSSTSGIGGPGIVGTVTNTSTMTMGSPSVVLFCFSMRGALLSDSDGDTGGDADLAPGGTASYSVGFPTDANDNPMSCPTYLVGASES